MIKDNNEYNERVKPDTAFLDKLKKSIPEFFLSNDKLDLNKFKNALKEKNIEEFNDGYQLDFIGKNYARRQSGELPTTVIVPDEDHNKDNDSKNLFFTGDNIEVLRHLQSNYKNKIDFIYIDPPYNTGNKDFIYPDNFEYSDKKLKEIFQINDDQLDRLKSISGSSSHSAWLTFMYPRLYLARKLLSDKGIIFISIDDNEQSNLKLLMNEIFGETTETLVWNKEAEGKSGSLKQILRFRNIHEYVLVGYKDVSNIHFNKVHEALKGKENEFDTANLAVNSESESNEHENYFTITNPSGDTFTRQWKWNKDEIDNLIKENLIYWGSDGHRQPRLILPNDERRTTYLQSILNYGGTTVGRKDYESIMPDNTFSYPKPIILIKKLLETASNKNSIILDFFAGSSSTAESVMRMNAEDGGNRQFIMVQLPEKTYKLDSKGNEVPTKGGINSYEAGFKSIDAISRERIIRSSIKIKEEFGLTLNDDFDGEFKHYTVIKPNKKTLDEVEEFNPNNINLFSNMVENFSSKELDVEGNASGTQTILTTWLSNDGYKFNTDIQKIYFNDYSGFLIDKNRLYLINEGWNSNDTKLLLNELGNYNLNIQTIVIFGYSFNIANLRELELGINLLDINVNLLRRY